MNSNTPYKNKIWLPLIFATFLAIGIFIGNSLSIVPASSKPAMPTLSFKGKQVDKLSSVVHYILKEYVDSIDQKTLEDDAIIALLEQLDPHSSYIPAKELASYTEPLEGNFDGIGIEFNIQKDTILVVAAISGGPSEALGIQSGDRIIKVDDELVAGVGITNEQVMKKLRGKRNTKVKVTILRRGKKELLDFIITRGQIPIFSVDVHYMLTNDIGYIKISRFAATTFKEYLEAFEDLQSKGLKKLVLDLRDNPGGYLTAAVDISDEFLPKGKQIVYTQGKNRKREDFVATSRGGFENGPLVILVDEGSASASEIVAGAVQDNDRGWVVGRRSFGKGLVQEEIRFQDGSAMRLTIARYYTPTGRSIQKPYEKGSKNYYEHLIEQLSNESTRTDSTAKDSTVYVTPGGRIVYGGGGIYPDFIVDRDTAGYTKMLSEIVRKGLINQFALSYADINRSQLLKSFPDATSFLQKFDASVAMPDFRAYVSKEGINYSMAEEKKSLSVLQTQIKAFIGRALHGNKGFFPVLHQRDPAIKKALELLQKDLAVVKTEKP